MFRSRSAREQHSKDFTSYIERKEKTDLWSVVFLSRKFGSFRSREMARLCIRTLKKSKLSTMNKRSL